ncbi:MAG TPA: gliding motility-associated C-terminal domain-containing protein [Chryseolinea sp.]
MYIKFIYLTVFGLCVSVLHSNAQFKTPVANPFGLNLFSGSQICGAFADMDADGDQDIVVSDLTNNKSHVMKNTGTVSTPVFIKNKTYNYDIHYLDLADLDYDGDIDIIGGSPAKQSFVWRENTGSPSAYKFKANIAVGDYNPFNLSLPPRNYMKTEMIDVDHNGRLDCLVSFYGYNAVDNVTNGINYYKDVYATGMPSFSISGYEPFNLSLPTPQQELSIESGDVDSDGDLDIVTGLRDGDLLFFENKIPSNPPYFSSPVTNPFNFTTHYDQKNLGDLSLDFVDIDADGDEDLFVFNGLNGDIVFYESAFKRPQAPIDLSAVHASSTSIQLTWQDNCPNEDGYRIERSTDGINFTEVLRADANVQSYQDKGLMSGQKYYYRIITFRKDETSLASNIASDTTPTDPNLLPPPAPLNLRAEGQGRTSIVLTWADVSTDEEGFGIERSKNNSNSFSDIAHVTGDSFSDTDVTLGTMYYYRVYSYKGTLQSYSNIVEINFDDPENPPPKPEPAALDIPTLFTPDGDAYNPTWNILNLENYSDHSVEVFDTSGKKVFSSSHYTSESEWDGSNNGKLLPAGTYIYIIKLNNGQQVNKGFITLLHQ